MAGKKARSRHPRRPVMELLDVIGRRWALRVLWELRDGPLTFRALAQACGGLSPSTLNTRLAELQRIGVVEHRPGEGYAITVEGEELGPTLLSLSDWAKQHLGG